MRELLADNPVLQKIQAGETVTGEELDDLARLLESSDAHVTEDLLRKVYDHRSAHFLQFIRHILGLEKLDSWPSTVTRAFDDFISAHTTLTALQIRFLQTSRRHPWHLPSRRDSGDPDNGGRPRRLTYSC